MSKYYTIYLRKTEELIASGSSRECARKMNKPLSGFYSMVSRTLHQIENKYDIVVENASDINDSDGTIE